jgi:glucosamine 6-phosphate synthetase-like amidotransferase/phosphosugar isomerase protein
LSIASEVRGTDATGISYVKDGVVKVFKKPKPAHALNLYFPADTKMLIGHTRYTTQGSEKQNQNNHPFISADGFSLAHNGVIYNDKELRMQYQLPNTNIETDSYIAVQLLEGEKLSFESIQFMAEQLDGSFAISILNHDNTLYLVKGSNPIYLVHFKSLGLYLYSSTQEIMFEALQKCNFTYKYDVVSLKCNDILKINAHGEICKSCFNPCDELEYFNSYYTYDELDVLLDYCNNFGIDEDDVYSMLDYGLELDEIEYIVSDETLLRETLTTIRNFGGFNYDCY